MPELPVMWSNDEAKGWPTPGQKHGDWPQVIDKVYTSLEDAVAGLEEFSKKFEAENGYIPPLRILKRPLTT